MLPVIWTWPLELSYEALTAEEGAAAAGDTILKHNNSTSNSTVDCFKLTPPLGCRGMLQLKPAYSPIPMFDYGIETTLEITFLLDV
ncbi:hypothetical protein GCM10023310_34180 [Paenibacillus vulneris]